MRLLAETARSLLALGLLITLVITAVALALIAKVPIPEVDMARQANRQLVKDLELTDLALWSEASYCRHPTQADRYSAWADHPAAFEHFPAGSIVPPLWIDSHVVDISGIKP
jgi:hypothetical protein